MPVLNLRLLPPLGEEGEKETEVQREDREREGKGGRTKVMCWNPSPQTPKM